MLPIPKRPPTLPPHTGPHVATCVIISFTRAFLVKVCFVRSVPKGILDSPHGAGPLSFHHPPERFDAGRKAAARRPLLFLSMNTVLYIDGFNLYYGCLRKTPHKWLNPVAMARHLLPGHAITAVRYFSANISARPGELDQPIRQQTYFRALRTLPGLTIQLGYFKAHAVAIKLVQPPPQGPTTSWVWRTDEKGSDVNLATQLLVDAFDDAFECAVVVTNDSDLLPQSGSCATASTKRSESSTRRNDRPGL